MPKRVTVRQLPTFPEFLPLPATDPEDTTEQVSEPHPHAGEVDLDQLNADLGDDTVWVGCGSAWDTPDGWEPGNGTFAIHDALTVNTDDPETIARVYAKAIQWELPGFPTVGHIREALAGKNLAIDTPLSRPSHADVLLALAAGEPYQP